MASVKDLSEYGISIETCRLVALEDYERLVAEGCRPQSGDVLIAKDGATALDTVCVVKESPDVVLLSSIAILRPDTNVLHPLFLRYVLSAPEVRDYIKGAFTSGAAIPRVVLKDFKRVLLPAPPLDIQRKIVAVLSAYDDLIENNNRRIKLLEEMAQRIYREWFVDFRYPGHQDVPLVESELGPVPEGWGVVPLSAVCERITDGAHLSPESQIIGRPMASVKDMTPRRLALNDCRRIDLADYEALVRQDCQPRVNDILIAKDGSYLKHVFVVREAEEVVILSSIALLRPNGSIQPDLLALGLRQPETKERLRGLVSGVAIPRIVLKDFRTFPIVRPPDELQRDFVFRVVPLLLLAMELDNSNLILRATRDLLLPRLISGQVDVAQLDIAMPELAA